MSQRCTQCQSPVAVGSRFCHACGSRLTSASDPPHFRHRRSLRKRRSLLADESVLWTGCVSWRALLPQGLLALALATAWVLLLARDLAQAAAGAAGIAALFGLYLSYRKLDETYVLTTSRLVYRLGLLRRITDFLEVIDLDDVTIEQAWWERLLGTGSIGVESSDRSRPLLLMRGIWPAVEVALLIDDTRHRERVTRGVHVEMV